MYSVPTAIAQYRSPVRTAEDKALLTFPTHHVEALEARPSNLVWCYSAPADATFLRVGNMQSPCMTGNATAQKERVRPSRMYVSGDTEGIGGMGLGNTISNARVLREISISQIDVAKLRPGTLIDSPTHDAHHGRITKRTAAFDFQFKFATMVSLMASLTQSDQI